MAVNLEVNRATKHFMVARLLAIDDLCNDLSTSVDNRLHRGPTEFAMPRVRQRRQPGGHAMVQLPDHYCAKHYEHEAEYLATRQRWARSHHMAKHTSASTNRWPGTGARLSPSSGSYYASRYSIVTTMSANTAANLTVRRWTSWCQEERTHRNCLTQNEVNASLHTHYSNGPVEGVNNRIRSSTQTAYGFRNYCHFRLQILLAVANSNLIFKELNRPKRDQKKAHHSRAA